MWVVERTHELEFGRQRTPDPRCDRVQCLVIDGRLRGGVLGWRVIGLLSEGLTRAGTHLDMIRCTGCAQRQRCAAHAPARIQLRPVATRR
ncbi:hypothetical protein AQ860_30175 [Burkholderia pseudomallei]|nr:hypothetical protein AQ760_07350 [Burkholderia pseudomallei]OMZ22890.1 hypothetical protein AQ859_30890 [Burkholderia pseudomallei]OMZ38791.1 hypothetical protein AQ860_30175 [Burkholderia pseudomallei]